MQKVIKQKQARKTPAPPIMSMSDLAQLGGGKVAYIKVMSTDEVREMFPAIEELPTGVDLFALHAADGTPLALTDSHQAAVGHAMGDELEIANLALDLTFSDKNTTFNFARTRARQAYRLITERKGAVPPPVE